MLWKYVSASHSCRGDPNTSINYFLELEASQFPCFPPTRVITQVSSEKYERKECQSNMIFLPEQIDTSFLPLEYNDNIRCSFTAEKTRAIRKLLESVDENHGLVFVWDKSEKQYVAVGVDSLTKYCGGSKKKIVPAYIVRIRAPMLWVISFSKILLFGYQKGTYVSADLVIKDKKEKLDKVIEAINTFVQKNDLDRMCDCRVWNNICNNILDAKHGTSFVIFADENEALKEAKRLSTFHRGILIKKPQDYSDIRTCNEFIKQNSAIDGGLIFDILGKCYAYGCIFDGTLPSKPCENFQGNSSRGSRYNSMSLYIFLKNDTLHEDHKTKCMGVVFSDDYSADTFM